MSILVVNYVLLQYIEQNLEHWNFFQTGHFIKKIKIAFMYVLRFSNETINPSWNAIEIVTT